MDAKLAKAEASVERKASRLAKLVAQQEKLAKRIADLQK